MYCIHMSTLQDLKLEFSPNFSIYYSLYLIIIYKVQKLIYSEKRFTGKYGANHDLHYDKLAIPNNLCARAQ